jgi:SAM-dependent methyltransferase
VITFLFFKALTLFERYQAARREEGADQGLRHIERILYFMKYSRQGPPLILRAESLVASDSVDQISPRGAAYDSSTNPRFNRKLYTFLKNPPELRVLDLGCSGGGFVKSILTDGYVAVGLEGSDLSLRLQRAEWPIIPLHLFTCDITKPFSIETPESHRFLFDVVTAWEVLEHIPKSKLPGLFENIRSNLKPSGVFIASIDITRDENPNFNAVYHQTVEKPDWWIAEIAKYGFEPVVDHGFVTADWVRGHGRGLEWDPADGEGFHVVVRKIS